MQEARRLLEPGSTIHPPLEDARTLLKWLLERRESTLSPREILQKSPLRTILQRDNALEILIEKHHIRLIKKGNATFVVLNP